WDQFISSRQDRLQIWTHRLKTQNPERAQMLQIQKGARELVGSGELPWKGPKYGGSNHLAKAVNSLRSKHAKGQVQNKRKKKKKKKKKKNQKTTLKEIPGHFESRIQESNIRIHGYALQHRV